MSDSPVNEVQRIQNEYLRRDKEGLSNIYTYSNPSFLFHMQERERIILKQLKKLKVNIEKSCILEVGCGTGHILARFKEFGANDATGIDLMAHRIHEGKITYPNLKLFHGNAANLPFDDNSFDIVMQFMCLSSVLDHEMRKQIVSEMWRVLKPGGVILFYDLKPPSTILRIIKKIGKIVIKSRGFFCENNNHKRDNNSISNRQTPIKWLDKPDIKTLFSQGNSRIKSASLDFDLAGFSNYSLILTLIASFFPFLTTHYLAFIEKPLKKRS